MHPANAIQVFRSSAADRAENRHLQRRQIVGELERVRRGVYVPRLQWEALGSAHQHLVRMRAVVPVLPSDAVFSHWSAAALHGVPLLDDYPARVHATCPSLPREARRVDLTLHAGQAEDCGRTFHGVAYASMEETVASLARRTSFSAAVVILSYALRSTRCDAERLRETIGSAPGWGRSRSTSALDTASAAHESVGESYLAARAVEIGAPVMVPQFRFRYADGTVDRVDFWLPSLGIVVEFDGRQKYEDPAMLRGRSGSDSLWAEKRREDRIRGRPEVHGFVRVTWWHLVDPERLRALFRAHGVPCR